MYPNFEQIFKIKINRLGILLSCLFYFNFLDLFEEISIFGKSENTCFSDFSEFSRKFSFSEFSHVSRIYKLKQSPGFQPESNN